MKKQWRKCKNDTFEQRPCIEHVDNMNKGFKDLPRDHEKCLWGKFGTIHKFSEKELQVIIFNSRIANLRLGGTLLYTFGEEACVNVPLEDLGLWVKWLRIPKAAATQTRYANGIHKKALPVPPPAPRNVE